MDPHHGPHLSQYNTNDWPPAGQNPHRLAGQEGGDLTARPEPLSTGPLSANLSHATTMPGAYSAAGPWSTGVRAANTMRVLQGHALQGHAGYQHVGVDDSISQALRLQQGQYPAALLTTPRRIQVPLKDAGPNPGQAGLYPAHHLPAVTRPPTPGPQRFVMASRSEPSISYVAANPAGAMYQPQELHEMAQDERQVEEGLVGTFLDDDDNDGHPHEGGDPGGPNQPSGGPFAPNRGGPPGPPGGGGDDGDGGGGSGGHGWQGRPPTRSPPRRGDPGPAAADSTLR